MRRQAIQWWVVGAVAILFLLGLSSLSNQTILGANPVAGLLISLVIIFVAVVAAAVGVSWSRR
jgi:hypothetical protein